MKVKRILSPRLKKFKEDLWAGLFEMERRCRKCGCTNDDCRGCIERTGQPCHWVEADLCSACVENAPGIAGNGPSCEPGPVGRTSLGGRPT